MLHFSEDARQCIGAYLGARMTEVPAMKVSTATVDETLRLVREFACYHVPARMKALDMYVAGVR